MSDGSVSMMDRLRAGLASALAGLAGGARRLEQWSARGTRPVVLGLVAVAVLAFGALAIVGGVHAFGGWWHHGPRGERMHAWQGPPPFPKPIGKPEGKPEGPFGRGPEGRMDARFSGKPEGKPEAPRPPAPPAPPQPPAAVTQP